jgi:hypothetical protein
MKMCLTSLIRNDVVPGVQVSVMMSGLTVGWRGATDIARSC